MGALYICSSERAVGKTAVCAGLAKHLQNNGKKIGFFKPLIASSSQDGNGDAVFMKSAFALEEPIELLSPAGDEGKIKEACAKVASGKDVVIIEGPFERRIAGALNARVIIVAGYANGLSKEKLTASYNEFKESLLGVVLNKVPRSQVERVRSEISQLGVNILGVLPEDRVLFTLTIGEIAEHVQGQILNNAEKSSELVENVMLGAMYVDPGLEYFGRKANKAAVLRGERPDMQLSALETSTRCLVLSGNVAPIPVVLNRAEGKKIPIVLSKSDTYAIIASLEDALSKSRFKQEKLSKVVEIMERNFDFKALYQGLGLAK